MKAGFSHPAPVGSAAVSGALLQLAQRSARGYLPAVQQEFTQSIHQLPDGMNKGAIEVWHQFACRMGICGYELNALACETELFRQAEASAPVRKDPAQQDTIRRFEVARREFIASRKGDAPHYAVAARMQQAALPLFYTGSRGAAVGSYLVLRASELWEGPGDPVAFFTGLSQIHFPQLNMPAWMHKYPVPAAD